MKNTIAQFKTYSKTTIARSAHGAHCHFVAPALAAWLMADCGAAMGEEISPE